MIFLSSPTAIWLTEGHFFCLFCNLTIFTCILNISSGPFIVTRMSLLIIFAPPLFPKLITIIFVQPNLSMVQPDSRFPTTCIGEFKLTETETIRVPASSFTSLDQSFPLKADLELNSVSCWSRTTLIEPGGRAYNTKSCQKSRRVVGYCKNRVSDLVYRVVCPNFDRMLKNATKIVNLHSKAEKSSKLTVHSQNYFWPANSKSQFESWKKVPKCALTLTGCWRMLRK